MVKVWPVETLYTPFLLLKSRPPKKIVFDASCRVSFVAGILSRLTVSNFGQVDSNRRANLIVIHLRGWTVSSSDTVVGYTLKHAYIHTLTNKHAQTGTDYSKRLALHDYIVYKPKLK